MPLLNFCKSSTKFCRLVNTTTPYLNISRNLARSRVKAHILKVTVLGAAGHVGQPLCLMLKQSPLIDELAVFDVVDTCSFATELGHIDTKCKMSAYVGVDQMKHALEDSKIVVVVAAARRSSFLPYNTMFSANANLILNIATNFACHCPRALLAIVTNPINSLVPLVSEVLKKNGVYNPKTVFGVTTLNSVRANAFAAEVQGLEPECVFVPVIGGHANKTIVPVLSQAKPCSDFTNDELERLTADVQNAHYDILKAKNKQSATLSCAFAVARFVISLIKGVKNKDKIIECAYVKSDAHPRATYLATPCLLGPGGIQQNFGVPKLSEYEKCQLENAATLLVDDIEKGEHFVLSDGEIVNSESSGDPSETRRKKSVCK